MSKLISKLKPVILTAGLIFIFLISIFIIVTIVGKRGPQDKLIEGNLRMGGKMFQVEIADNMMSRERGLSGREGLKENEGMLFIFSYSAAHSFWMKDMKFPIDMIWINGDTIVGYADSVQPPSKENPLDLPSYSPPQSIDKVLEVRAGTARELNLRAGDKIEYPAK